MFGKLKISLITFLPVLVHQGNRTPLKRSHWIEIQSAEEKEVE